MADVADAGLARGVSPSPRRSAGPGPVLHVIATAGFPDYALLDSGDGRKLERFGRFTVERPESQALWRPRLEPGAWLRADAAFKNSGADEDSDGGRWRSNTAVPPIFQPLCNAFGVATSARTAPVMMRASGSAALPKNSRLRAIVPGIQ